MYVINGNGSVLSAQGLRCGYFLVDSVSFCELRVQCFVFRVLQHFGTTLNQMVKGMTTHDTLDVLFSRDLNGVSDSLTLKPFITVVEASNLRSSLMIRGLLLKFLEITTLVSW